MYNACPEDRFSHDLAHIIVKPVFSNHIKQDIFLAYQTGGCLLLHESSAQSSTLLSFSNVHVTLNRWSLKSGKTL